MSDRGVVSGGISDSDLEDVNRVSGVGGFGNINGGVGDGVSGGSSSGDSGGVGIGVSGTTNKQQGHQTSKHLMSESS